MTIRTRAVMIVARMPIMVAVVVVVAVAAGVVVVAVVIIVVVVVVVIIIVEVEGVGVGGGGTELVVQEATLEAPDGPSQIDSGPCYRGYQNGAQAAAGDADQALPALPGGELLGCR